MGINTMLVEERSRDIGSFMVGRLLPFKRKRQVGPFTFIDHMGPSRIESGTAMDVDQHPHIGLCTLTYLFEGEVEHKDSTGAQAVVTPGDVGLMTSGSGVTHTERTPKHLRNSAFNMHGYQVWIALPLEKEEMAPRFDFLPKSEVPSWKDGQVEIKLVAGKGFGKSSPLPVHSDLFMIDLYSPDAHSLNIDGELEGEIAVVVVNGKVGIGDQKIAAGQMLISSSDNQCSIELHPETRLLLFGGPALEEERYLHWNFVSSSKQRLEKAKQDWINRKFPKVPGDDTYVSMPGS